MTSIAYFELSVSRTTPPSCSVITARTGDVANTSGASSCSVTVRRTAYGIPGIGGDSSSPSTTWPSSSISGRPFRVAILRILTCSLTPLSPSYQWRVATPWVRRSRGRRGVSVEQRLVITKHSSFVDGAAELLGDPSRCHVLGVDEADHVRHTERREGLTERLATGLGGET